MVYRYKYDVDDSSLINKKQLASSGTNFQNGSESTSDTVTSNEQRVKALDNMMGIMDGSRKEKTQGNNTTATITTERSSSRGFLEMAKNVAAVGSAVIVTGWGLYCLLSSTTSSSEEEKKKMKAPGQKGKYIFRDAFENNPRDYFRQQRSSKR